MKSILRPFIFVGAWLKRHWKITIFLVIILAAVAIFAFRQTHKPAAQLNFVPVKKEKLTKKLNVSGIVDAKRKASLHYATGGKVTFIGAKQGDIVKKNQTLARIDTADLQKRLQQDLNNYYNERLTFETNNNDRTFQTQTEDLRRAAEQDQKSLENSVIDVELRDISIKNAALISPLAGFLVSSPTDVSGVVLSAADVFQVVDPTSLVFKAAVDETDIAQVTKGQMASIQLDAFPDESVNASVSAISYQSAQTSKGTVFVVELPIPIQSTQSAIDRYRLGMNGDTDIIIDEKENVLQIPIDTLSERDGKKFVQKKTGDNTSQEVEIKTGLETDDTVEVTEGLQLGDQVVLP